MCKEKEAAAKAYIIYVVDIYVDIVPVPEPRLASVDVTGIWSFVVLCWRNPQQVGHRRRTRPDQDLYYCVAVHSSEIMCNPNSIKIKHCGIYIIFIKFITQGTAISSHSRRDHSQMGNVDNTETKTDIVTTPLACYYNNHYDYNLTELFPRNTPEQSDNM